MKAVGIPAVMEGYGVVRQEIPAGELRLGGEIYSEMILMEIIASENAEELRRCRRCREDKPAGDYDHNRQGGLLLTCRLCLVSHPKSQFLLIQ